MKYSVVHGAYRPTIFTRWIKVRIARLFALGGSKCASPDYLHSVDQGAYRPTIWMLSFKVLIAWLLRYNYDLVPIFDSKCQARTSVASESVSRRRTILCLNWTHCCKGRITLKSVEVNKTISLDHDTFVDPFEWWNIFTLYSFDIIYGYLNMIWSVIFTIF